MQEKYYRSEYDAPCLMCGKRKGEGSLRDVLIGTDPLCEACRNKWERNVQKTNIGPVIVETDYVYNDAFAQCLLQFKECHDEALKDVFLYEVKKRLQTKYRGYTLLGMPSSSSKEAERGFSHIEEMYACLHMPMLFPFEKTKDMTQKGKNEKERMEMEGCIRLKEGIQIPQKIVLVDDILTTGATLRGAMSCISAGDFKIRAYCVAKA